MRIAHWSPKRFADKIDSTGHILCEQDTGLLTVKDDNGRDSNLAWLTQDLARVPGAVHCLGLNIFMAMEHCMDHLDRKPTAQEFDNFMHDWWHEKFDNQFVRYEFDSQTIKAKTWMFYKNTYIRGSHRRRVYCQQLDQKSRWNGDDVDKYWVTDRAIDLKHCVARTEHTMNYEQALASVGIGASPYAHFLREVESMNKLSTTEQRKFLTTFGE